jgi:hypothetical protein
MDETFCRTCDLVLPFEMFTRVTRNFLGLSLDCKDCQSKARKKRQRTAKYRKYQREYHRAWRARKRPS